MAEPVNMPQVGQDLKTAIIVEWHVNPGDHVNEGDVIATVESDKASFEVETFTSGTVLKLLFDEREEGEVFKPIAWIGAPGETAPGGSSAEKVSDRPGRDSEPLHKRLMADNEQEIGKLFSSPSARRVAAEQNVDIRQVRSSGPGNRVIKKDVLAHAASMKPVRSTPLAREMAKMEGIELNELNGTGALGRILKKDVLEAVKKHVVHPVPREDDEVIWFNRVRKVIAERLSISKLTIPHYYLNIDADLENALKVRDKLQSDLEVKISVNDILVFITAKVLSGFPWLNAHVDDDKLIIKRGVHIGIAVSTDEGLMVPVLAHADKKDLPGISKEIRKLADDARRKIVNLAQEGSFTISNLGMFGISGFQAIINPPQCAILSLGAIEKKVIPVENGLKVTDMINIGLAVDHRAVDGAYAAKFLNELKTELMNFKI